MLGSLLTFILFAGIIIRIIYKFAKFCWMAWFDSTLIYYSTESIKDLPNEPFEFVHERNEYKVFVKHERMKNHMQGTKLSRSYVYINDNLVLMVSRMRCAVLEKRSIDVDLKYVNSDVFRILKWARIHWNEEFCKNDTERVDCVKLIKD